MLKEKKISLKELIILGILIVAAAYYFGFHMPVSKQIEEAQVQLDEVTSELELAELQAMDCAKMRQELEKLQKSGAAQNPLPQYNNTNGVLVDLNTILSGTNYYDINFGDVTSDGYIVRRPISVSYSVNSYTEAVEKMREIRNSANRYLLRDVSMRTGVNNEIIIGNSDAFTTVTLSLTAFEYVSPNGEQPPVSEAEKKKAAEAALAEAQAEEQ